LPSMPQLPQYQGQGQGQSGPIPRFEPTTGQTLWG
jgi:hypothetical protein